MKAANLGLRVRDYRVGCGEADKYFKRARMMAENLGADGLLVSRCWVGFNIKSPRAAS
jgi:hypothetical protein